MTKKYKNVLDEILALKIPKIATGQEHAEAAYDCKLFVERYKSIIVEVLEAKIRADKN